MENTDDITSIGNLVGGGTANTMQIVIMYLVPRPWSRLDVWGWPGYKFTRGTICTLGADVGGGADLLCRRGQAAQTDDGHCRHATFSFSFARAFHRSHLFSTASINEIVFFYKKILVLQNMKIKRFWIEGIYHVTHRIQI